MRYIKTICYLLFTLCIWSMISCTKQVNSNTIITDTTGTTVNTTPPKVQFYNVMDYGSTAVLLNGTQVTTVARYYASNYIKAKAGTNTIALLYPSTSTTNVLNINYDFVAGQKYSCVFYRVGYEWKACVLIDDTTTPASGTAYTRVLDFRTQAYFDYVNVRMGSPGYDDQFFLKRNFLDQTTYSSKAAYKQVSAASYNIYVYDDTMTVATRKSVPFSAGNKYTVLLTTNTKDIASVAHYYIFPDVVNNKE